MTITSPCPSFRALVRVLPLLLILAGSATRVRADAATMDAFGVCASPQSTSGYEAYCDDIIASGIKWVRISPEWGSIETARGVFNTTYLDRLDAIVSRLRAHDVNILWILCYTAPWASSQPALGWPDATRYKPADWTDWENYVAFIVDRYDGQIRYWEVWNEPDLNGFWKSSVADYYTLLAKAHAKIKARNATNQVLLGGLAVSTGTDFFEELLDLGAASYFDITNYHAYGPIRRHVSLYEQMIGVTTTWGITDKPIWITETGYTTVGDAALEPVKAGLVEQIQHGNQQRPEIARAFWYRFENTASTPANPSEDNFGLLTAARAPLAAFYAYQACNGAETDFGLQAAYAARTPVLRTLFYVPATSGDGSYVIDNPDDTRTIPASRYLYLRVNDDWIHDANQGLDTTLDAEVTYLDSGTGNFALQYDAAANAYQSLSQARTNTGTWKTATFTLTDVKFANRQNNAADLRLSAGGTDLTVGQVTLRRRINPAVAILGATPVSRFIDYVIDPDSSHEGYNPVATVGGLECRQITANNRFFYFNVSDSLVRSGDTHLSVAITFRDQGTDNIVLQYNAVGNAHKGVNIPKTNTNAWRTVTVAITDADFVNAQSYFSDFRIANGFDSSAEYVRRVEVILP
ncbi:hypothetical protein OPIT5_04435 [Opitutaceae bacterium TAV5]|nr:hypothetical protein OPIT5_04435 [Opitutaceae bacterium TAV5]